MGKQRQSKDVNEYHREWSKKRVWHALDRSKARNPNYQLSMCGLQVMNGSKHHGISYGGDDGEECSKWVTSSKCRKEQAQRFFAKQQKVAKKNAPSAPCDCTLEGGHAVALYTVGSGEHLNQTLNMWPLCSKRDSLRGTSERCTKCNRQHSTGGTCDRRKVTCTHCLVALDELVEVGLLELDGFVIIERASTVAEEIDSPEAKAKCAVCTKEVPEPEGPVQLTNKTEDGRWACSEECWEQIASERDRFKRAEYQRALARLARAAAAYRAARGDDAA